MKKSGVAYLLYTDVFSTDSKTAIFNRATDELKADSRVVDLLGPSKEIRAFGEASWSRWARNRTIAYVRLKLDLIQS
jgi:import inner membrane translocase subunit TIM21